jgi:hypothetical protein
MLTLSGRNAGLVVCVLALILGIKPASALTLEFVPQTQTVLPGDTASVDVYLNFDGDINAPLVKDFSIDVGWNPALLSMAGVAFDDYLNGGVSIDSVQAVTPATGSAHISESSSLASVDLCLGITAGGQCSTTTGFRLFTLSFNTLAVGVSGLAFGPIVAHNDFDDPITIVSGPNGAVTVMSAPVPEPVTLPLLGGGLSALACAGAPADFFMDEMYLLCYKISRATRQPSSA